ncbi:MAG: hypothetical protein ACYTAF_07985 [Planctomycetota bacterium]|jgi:hypothetical protein
MMPILFVAFAVLDFILACGALQDGDKDAWRHLTTHGLLFVVLSLVVSTRRKED